MTLNTYLQDRKSKKLLDLLLEHAGRCRAVGKSFFEASQMIKSGNKNDLPSRVAIIKAEERSADEVEAKINREVATTNILPTKLGEELLTFVRTLDRAAGAAKRAVINFELLMDYSLPKIHADNIGKCGEILKEIFVQMETALKVMVDVEKVKEITFKINAMETEIDNIYVELKRGYFEVEKIFKSAAALIILDHAFRDLEACADFGEDASELLLTLVSRRG